MIELSLLHKDELQDLIRLRMETINWENFENNLNAFKNILDEFYVQDVEELLKTYLKENKWSKLLKYILELKKIEEKIITMEGVDEFLEIVRSSTQSLTPLEYFAWQLINKQAKTVSEKKKAITG